MGLPQLKIVGTPDVRNGMIKKPVRRLTELFTVAWKNLLYIACIFFIHGFDLLAGPIFLSNFNNNTGSTRLAMTGLIWTVAIVSTVLKIAFWDYIEGRKLGAREMSSRQRLLIGICGVMMFVDLMFTIGFVTQAFYPGINPTHFIPDTPNFVWYLMAVAAGIITTFGDPILKWLHRLLDNKDVMSGPVSV